MRFVKTFIILFGLLSTLNAFTADNFGPKFKSVDPEETKTGLEPFTGQPSEFISDVSFGLGIHYFDSFGLHGTYAYKLLDKGLIQDFNDSLYLEGGLRTTFYGTVKNETGIVGISLLANVRWDLNYDKQWTLFGTLGFGLNNILIVSNSDVTGGGFFPAIGVGAYYMIKDNYGMRFDLSYQLLGISGVIRF